MRPASVLRHRIERARPSVAVGRIHVGVGTGEFASMHGQSWRAGVAGASQKRCTGVLESLQLFFSIRICLDHLWGVSGPDEAAGECMKEFGKVSPM